jgi:alanine racemase
VTERAVARIDVGAVERNCARLPKPLCAVVKADAYGHSVGPVVEAALAGGATWLAVATAAEAVELRALEPDVPILVMGAVTRDELRVAVAAGADVVAWSEEVAEAAPRVHVKLDTGMGRLGTRDRELALRLASGPNTVGLMTHFATADELDDDLFPAQLAEFRGFVDEVGRDDLLVHAANSAAALRDPAAHFDMVRCGVASCIPGWLRCGGSSRGRAWATGDAGGRRSPPGWRPCRSATAMAGGARSRTTAMSSSVAGAIRSSAW